MSGELRIASATGATVYANILNASSQRWNGSTFETYVSANYDTYDIVTVEQGSSGVYVGDFPTGISSAGDYSVIYYLQENASPTEGDQVVGTGTISWDGDSLSADEDVASGEMTGLDWETYVLRTFKRTDKSDELFDATNAAIAEIRRKFTTGRDEKETTMTDTIATLGEYRLDLETDFGLPVSSVYIQDTNDGRKLRKISKEEWDEKYGVWGTSTSDRDIPQEYAVFGNQIYLGPIPNQTDYQYVISYGRANLTAVTIASLAVPYTTADYKECLLHGTLWRLYKLVENDDQAGAYKALWDDELEQIKTVEKKKTNAPIQVLYRDV